MSVFDILITYYPAFLTGLQVTLLLFMLVCASGLLVGGALGVVGARHPKQVGRPSYVVSVVLSSIPVLVLLFWLHYPAQSMFDIVLPPFWTAAIAFSLLNIFAVSDLVRAALRDFPKQYIVAAQVTGLTRKQIRRHIQFPLLLRSILPGLLILQISMLHMTLFASLISVEEIFRVAQRINSQIYRPVEIYTALAVFFLLVCLPVNAFALYLRARFTRDLSEK